MALARIFLFTFVFLVLSLALLSSAAEGASRRPPRHGSKPRRHSLKAKRGHSKKGPRRPTLKGPRRSGVKSQHSRPGSKAPLPVLAFTTPLPLPPPVFIGSVVDARTYGATPDGQSNSKAAFTQAWNAACASNGPSKLLIPPGQYFAGEIFFEGPCKNPMTVEFQGTILADPNPDAFQGNEGILFQNIEGLTVYGGGTYDGQGGVQSWKNGQSRLMPISIKFQKVRNGAVRDLNLVNSKGFQMTITSCTNFLAERLKITAPADSPRTDGIHLSRSNGVQVLNSFIGTGDDCISIGEGSTDVKVIGITCGPGHGISIGSLGKVPQEQSVKGVYVGHSTLSNTDNGLRIKTFHDSPPLEASGITFEDITMVDVKNPIIIDQHYKSNENQGASFVKISDVHYRNVRGTSVSNVAVSLQCSSAIPCQGIELADIDLALSPNAPKKFPLSATCSNAKTSSTGKQNPPACR
ncbi:hypothetical protein Vadar_008605 [Vaccinium darrowii]|uniref:Uncharacterized protein n=1 Tax=Vaccinium darrowii TaxID=229202 RepID=A0ACB7ZA61_9ERIC|nr:hypothetical protein Vadar_008605 [Vaccinium darrowii]